MVTSRVSKVKIQSYPTLKRLALCQQIEGNLEFSSARPTLVAREKERKRNENHRPPKPRS